MTPSDEDPPSSSDDQPPSESGTPAGVSEPPVRGNDSSLGQVISLDSLSRETVRNFLATAETRHLVIAIVAASVPATDVDDVAQCAIAEALESLKRKVPDRAETLRAWIGTITRRVVADYVIKRKRRSKYEGPMPEAAQALFEGDPTDAEGPSDGLSLHARLASPSVGAEPIYDPWAEDGDHTKVHAWWVRQWLEREVANHPRDRETLEILLDHARGEKTYQAIAQERGISLTALSSRIFEFKQKYIPRYRQWRNRAVLVLLLAGAAVILAIVVWWLLSGKPTIGPDPSVAPPRPPLAPSATASVPAPFEPALPPSRRRSPVLGPDKQ
jgi:DNA-directed RNA polymerase specialized sigma24 family protein